MTGAFQVFNYLISSNSIPMDYTWCIIVIYINVLIQNRTHETILLMLQFIYLFFSVLKLIHQKRRKEVQ